jgi:hypothetical protein
MPLRLFGRAKCMGAAVGQQSCATRDRIASGNLLPTRRYSQSGEQRDTTRRTARLAGVNISLDQ